ncbi:CopM family metallochaperone [Falsiroseomonas sp. CW058]|uniref:CopM family metallochaperone n=1 Tax=Falsiroseomonas sp. CW058 TaxID=3388664 RepID=UPI003D322C75
MSPIIRGALRCAAALAPLLPTGAAAHVKWFQPYQVAEPPVPIATTLSLPALWIGAALASAFFVAAMLVERSAAGPRLLTALDAATGPLKARADRFLLWVLTAFFVSLFAIGGTYLTPELRTEAEWVPWLHLVVALLLASRLTRPVAAALIVLVWVLTLREYDLFHLFDYLALGLGVAGFLLLSGVADETWHARRFAVLRLGIAVSLMWSSMEKFEYPQWFAPLLEEKPYLALGMPFGPYTTMAGVAEFTLGFGLLWTPLIRRLAAAALFVLMFAAVYPFGRIDLIGHAIILATLAVGVAEPETGRSRSMALVHGMASGAPRAFGRATALMPVALAAAFAITILGYSGAHHAIYQRGGPAFAWARAQTGEGGPGLPPPAGFWRGQEHYHGPGAGPLTGVEAPPAPTGGGGHAGHADMAAAMARMQQEMAAAPMTGDPDRDFVAMMLPHHQGAVDMARLYLRAGRDPALRRLAEGMVADQEEEIRQMRGWSPR